MLPGAFERDFSNVWSLTNWQTQVQSVSGRHIVVTGREKYVHKVCHSGPAER